MLYITDQGTTLTKEGDRLVVEKKGRRIHWVHAFQVDQVVIMGSVGVTPGAAAFLLQQGIDTVFLSYYGKYRGRLISEFAKNVELRRLQFRKMDDSAFRLEMAKKYVRGKIDNQRVLLRRQNRDSHDDEVTAVIHHLRRLKAKVDECDSVDSLMGVEGVSAAKYFGVFGRLIRVPDITFESRNRRPPKDPVNVLLSLGYTLLGNAVQTQVYVTGLDPFLGCLHSVEFGRPSLVLDLMEEFRPILVDALVLSVVNRRVMRPTDFFRPEDREPAAFDFAETEPVRENFPIILKHEGMKRFITAFEGRLNQRVIYLPLGKTLTYRGVILEQVRLLARSLTEDAVYVPFAYR